jgi:hypothetical protein
MVIMSSPNPKYVVIENKEFIMTSTKKKPAACGAH